MTDNTARLIVRIAYNLIIWLALIAVLYDITHF